MDYFKSEFLKNSIKHKVKNKVSLLKEKTSEWYWATIAVIFFSSLYVGCATNERVDTDNAAGDGDKAHPAADIGARFNVGAPRTIRSKGEPASSFFFEDCKDTGDSTYYSKTSYLCN